MEQSGMAPGFRFSPTDEELVVYYLKNKITGKKFHQGLIHEADLYKFEPGDLRGICAASSKDPVWYFFNCQDKKHSHTARTNRTTPHGYWKATGKDRKVQSGSSTVGMKKTLVYYEGRAPSGKRTDWIMHEYRLEEESDKKATGAIPCTLCRLRKKGGLGPRNGEQYGAPLTCEEIDELESKLENVADDAGYGLPSLSESRDGSEIIGVTSQCGSSVPLVSGQDNYEPQLDIDAFLSDIISEGPSSNVGSILGNPDGGFESNHQDIFADLDCFGPPLGNYFDNAFHNLLHPDNDEGQIIEDMSHLVAARGNGEMILPETCYHQNDLWNGDYFELDDIKPPIDGLMNGYHGNKFDSGGQQFSSTEDVLLAQGSALRRVRLQMPSSSGERETTTFQNSDAVVNVPQVIPGLSFSSNLYKQHTSRGNVTGSSKMRPYLSSESKHPSTGHIQSSATSFLLKHNPSHTIKIYEEVSPETYYAALTDSVDHDCLSKHGPDPAIHELKLQKPSECVVTTSFEEKDSPASPCCKVISDSLVSTTDLNPARSGLKSAITGFISRIKSGSLGTRLSRLKGNISARFNERVSGYGKPASQLLQTDSYINPYNCMRRGMVSLLYLLLAVLIFFCIFIGFHTMAKHALAILA